MKKNNKKGFTLVELVIVVAVMAILVAVAIPTVSYVTSQASDAVTKSNCQTIESLVKLAEADAKTKSASATLDADKVAKAMSDGKLGITEGTYFYDTKTGKVDTKAPTGAAENPAKYFEIKFEKDGVSAKSEATGAKAIKYDWDGKIVNTPGTP